MVLMTLYEKSLNILRAKEKQALISTDFYNKKSEQIYFSIGCCLIDFFGENRIPLNVQNGGQKLSKQAYSLQNLNFASILNVNIFVVSVTILFSKLYTFLMCLCAYF